MADHADLSRRLALALGYLPEHVKQEGDDIIVARFHTDTGLDHPWWRAFDYRDPSIIWPIAERYNCFPRKHFKGFDGWGCCAVINGRTTETAAFDTAAEAVARAVIGAHE